MAQKLRSPDDLRVELARRYARQHRDWLIGAGGWPLSFALGAPTEREATEDPAGVRAWIAAWSAWGAPSQLSWQDVRWPRLGAQRLPSRVSFGSPAELAQALDEPRFDRAAASYHRFCASWPALTAAPCMARHFDLLADYGEADLTRLFALLSWLRENPRSGRYLRQLPVAGIDTKWAERRRGVVVDFLEALGHDVGDRDFYTACGLVRPEHRLRLFVLCPELRLQVAGLRDVEAMPREIANMGLAPRSVLVLENLESALALPDMHGAVAFAKLGNAVSLLGDVPWIHGVPVTYWGDIDTHGLAILDRARAALGEVRSVLMDEATLTAHRPLWSVEASPCSAGALAFLTEPERALFLDLREGRWGAGVRLEQERIPWELALDAILSARR